MSDVKKGNAQYANWSRLLREVVEYWGQMGWNADKEKGWNTDQNRAKGPFYCGVNWSHQNITLLCMHQPAHQQL